MSKTEILNMFNDHQYELGSFGDYYKSKSILIKEVQTLLTENKNILQIYDKLRESIFYKTCDLCGETTIGLVFDVVDENHNKQDDLIQCEKCYQHELGIS